MRYTWSLFVLAALLVIAVEVQATIDYMATTYQPLGGPQGGKIYVRAVSVVTWRYPPGAMFEAIAAPNQLPYWPAPSAAFEAEDWNLASRWGVQIRWVEREGQSPMCVLRMPEENATTRDAIAPYEAKDVLAAIVDCIRLVAEMREVDALDVRVLKPSVDRPGEWSSKIVPFGSRQRKVTK